MTKQLRFTSETLSPLYKMSIGFDRLADQFFNDPSFANTQTGYPPFNITKQIVEGNDEPLYAITLAIAGFTVEFLHKGIAERNFVRTFKLADYVEVESAKLDDGILRINLFRNVPEALKPKTINIT